MLLCDTITRLNEDLLFSTTTENKTLSQLKQLEDASLEAWKKEQRRRLFNLTNFWRRGQILIQEVSTYEREEREGLRIKTLLSAPTTREK